MMFFHTLRERLEHSTGTIVVRLRMVLWLIAAVTAIAGIAATLQSRHILWVHAQLNQTALPMLIQAQKVEQNLNQLFIIQESFSAATTEPELRKLDGDLAQQSMVLRDNVTAVKAYLATPDLAESIIASVDSAESSARKVLEGRVSLLRMQGEVDGLLRDIGEIQRASTRLLEAMSFETTSQIEALLRQARQGQIGSAELVDRLFSELFLASLNYNNLQLGFEVIVDLARTQRFQREDAASVAIRKTFDLKLNDLTWQLSQLPASEERSELARLTFDLRRLLLEDSGLFSRLNAQETMRADLQAARLSRKALVEEVSALASDLVANAREEVAAASGRLRNEARTLVWMLAAALFVSLGTVLFANAGIIENQINRRMRALNKAVSAIAKGDLDHPITVHGDDELGDMARALQVFKKNAQELRRSNEELEKFAYVAAHDLRSPLRAIHDLSVWTMEDGENQLSEESQAYMNLLQARVQRLNRLLNDLLDYARAGRSEIKPQAVDLPQLLQQLMAGIDPDKAFQITYDGPTAPVRTYLTPLTQILVNLISNAVKHHDRKHGLITISAEVTQGRLHLTICDDGPGISPDYQQKVFELFQTLRPRDEVEGSGLGLAIVTKLAEYYGGKVTLTSDPDQARGARFDVDLPVFEESATSHPPPKQVAA